MLRRDGKTENGDFIGKKEAIRRKNGEKTAKKRRKNGKNERNFRRRRGAPVDVERNCGKMAETAPTRRDEGANARLTTNERLMINER